MSIESRNSPATAPGQMKFMHVPPSPLNDRAEQFMVRMRDGIRLATDVYLPDAEGPRPVILTRLPYDKNGQIIIPNQIITEAFVERGYVVVVQDVRGKFRSEGERIPWVFEAHDGYDTIEWIVNQPWSNSRVGMTGYSYPGFVQWAALSTNHPALRAIAPRATNTMLGTNEMTPGEPEWAYPFQYVMDFFTVNGLLMPEIGWDWNYRPLAKGFEAAVEQMGVCPPAMHMHLAKQTPTRHLRFPEGDPLEATPIPVLLSLGFFDPYCAAEAMRKDYPTLVNNPAWKPFVHLRLAPIDHCNIRIDARPANMGFLSPNDAPASDAPENTPPSIHDPAQVRAWLAGELQFFDRYLKVDDSVAPLPPVEYQLAHGDEVRRSESWPPPEAVRTVLHLADKEGNASGRLVARPIGEASKTSWVHNPDDLVPGGATLWSFLVAEWPDFRKLAVRGDVLTFRGDPQDRPMELAGPATLHVRVKATGPEMDLFAYLLDVEPDGSMRFISRGQQRLAAPEPTDLTMSVGEAGYLLRPGHSLALMLCSSNFPDFIPLTGTSERWWFATEMQSTTQTVDIGGDTGARLELTVIPAGRA